MESSIKMKKSELLKEIELAEFLTLKKIIKEDLNLQKNNAGGKKNERMTKEEEKEFTEKNKVIYKKNFEFLLFYESLIKSPEKIKKEEYLQMIQDFFEGS